MSVNTSISRDLILADCSRYDDLMKTESVGFEALLGEMQQCLRDFSRRGIHLNNFRAVTLITHFLKQQFRDVSINYRGAIQDFRKRVFADLYEFTRIAGIYSRAQ